jgi:hypothetical protein
MLYPFDGRRYMMNENNRTTKLCTYSLFATILIFSGVFVLEVIDYVGTINVSDQTEVSIPNIWITTLEEDKLRITINFVITNPTEYSRIELHYVHYSTYLKLDSAEKFIEKNTYFIHDHLIPHEELSFNTSFYVQKSKIEYISTYDPNSRLRWRIKCLIFIETPLKNIYQTKNIFVESGAIVTSLLRAHDPLEQETWTRAREGVGSA